MIIPTKLNQPLVRADLVTRTNLDERLREGLTKKLTLVSAPAGFGKTTLISAWLNHLPYQASWLSLDQRDNNFSRFLAYLEISLNPFRSNKECLYENFTSADHQYTEQFLEKALQKMANQRPFRLLVLDDYHLITNQKVHNTLVFLLNNLPLPDPSFKGGGKGCHVVLLTRSDPPFPVARWRVHHQVNEIRTDDLRFSLEETAQLFNHSMQLGLSLEDVAELKSRAEGWVAGLQLAGVSLQGQKPRNHHHFISQIKGSYRLLADFLIEEVYLQQTPEIQDFLLKTSILDRMNGELCDALLQSFGGNKILTFLERNNVFVVPLDHDRHWYRYHHFFAEVLADRLKAIQDEEYKQLHIRAAQWLEEHEFIEDSVRHWLQAKDYQHASSLIVRTASKLLDQGKFYILRSLVELFPEESFQRSPWLSIYRSWTCFMLEPAEMETWLMSSERVIDSMIEEGETDTDEINEMLGNIAAIRALAAVRQGDLEKTLSLAPYALALLPEKAIKVRGLVFNAIGTSCMLKGEQEKALEHFMEAKTILRKGGNFGGSADALSFAGEIQLDRGELRLALDTFKEAISLEKYHSGGEPCYVSQAYSGVGQILFEWNQLDEAFWNFQNGYQYSGRMGVSNQISCAIPMVAAWLELGQLDKAEEVLSQYSGYIGHTSLTPWVDSRLVATQIHFLAAQADFREIDHLIRYRGIDLGEHFTLTREPEYTAVALSYLMRGNMKQAVNLSTRLEGRVGALGSTGRQIRLLAILAASLSLLGQQKAALKKVARAFKLAGSEGFIRSFVAMGEPMLSLIAELADSEFVETYRLDKAYLGEVVSAFIAGEDGSAFYNPLRTEPARAMGNMPGLIMEPLTERELEVLQLLAAEKNNREIASRLSISINTVKTHIANIYSKLGVSNRLQAANRVRQLKIF